MEKTVGFWERIWQMLLDSSVLQVIWALLVLVVGWLLAVVIAGQTGRLIRKMGLRKRLPEHTGNAAGTVEKIVTRIVFYVIILLTVLGCLTILQLTETAGPIRDFVGQITSYAANLIAAGLLFFIAWITASILRVFAATAMKALKIDEKFAVKSEEGETVKPLSGTVGNVVYYVTFLFFIPAILRALRINGITAPLEQMLAKLLGFVPNLIAAAAVLFFGLLIARIVRKAVTGLLFIGQLDTICTKAGCKSIFGDRGVAHLVGLVAYVLVAIPVVIVALAALQVQALTNSVAGFLDLLLNATGSVIGAAIVIFAAFVIGSIIAGIVAQLCEAFGFNRLIGLLGFSPKLESTVTPSAVMGKLTLIVIMFLASIVACDMLGFLGLKELLTSFLYFGGSVLIGVVVVMVGIFLANLAAGLVHRRNEKNQLLAMIVRVAVLIFTGAIALEYMNIGGNIVRLAFGLLLGAVCVAAALAFGLGGREFAAKKLEEWSNKLKDKN